MAIRGPTSGGQFISSGPDGRRPQNCDFSHDWLSHVLSPSSWMPEFVALAFIVALQHPAVAQKAPQRVPPRAVEGGPDLGVWRMRHHARVGESL